MTEITNYMKTTFDTQTIELNPSGDNFIAVVGDKKYHIEIARVNVIDGRMDLRITELSESVSIRESVIESVYISLDGAKRWVTIDGQTIMLTKTSGAKRGVRHDSAGGLTAPMPGQVRSVAVSVGDVVKKGQTLLTIEAMKMEIRIQALKDGKVKVIHVTQNQTVEREQILIEMED